MRDSVKMTGILVSPRDGAVRKAVSFDSVCRLRELVVARLATAKMASFNI